MYPKLRSALRPAHALAHTLSFALLCALLFALALATLPQAHAQSRTFPSHTKLGALEITVFPRATLDEKPIVMAPGVRILNESNLIQLPSTVRGLRAVRYRTDMLGQVIEVWLLTPQELAVAQDEARRAAAATR